MAIIGAMGDAPLVRGRSRRGLSLFVREIALDGSNPTPVVTPFRSIIGVMVMPKASVATVFGDALHNLSYDISGGTVNLYGWTTANGTDPTIDTASTSTATVTVWVAGIL